MAVEWQEKKHLVQNVDRRAHRGHDETTQDTHQRRQSDKARFSCPYDRAHATRNFEAAGEAGQPEPRPSWNFQGGDRRLELNVLHVTRRFDVR